MKAIKKFLSILATIYLTISLASCITHKAAFNGQSIPQADKRAELFDQNKLNNLTKELKSISATTGLMILHDGKVAYEYGDLSVVSYLASCRKSVLSILYGTYIEDGTVDLDQEIGELSIDEDDGLMPIEKRAKVDHIITSRSGVFHKPANGGYDERNIKKRGSKEPGEYFVYNNWDFNVAGHILEVKTGNSVYEEVERQLAIPLGFEDWNIKNQKRTVRKKKSRYSAYHIYLSTRDMAKIGQLMLNGGEWNGKQLIPADWVEKSTSTVTPVEVVNERMGGNSESDIQFSYGYMWWLFENFHDNPNMQGAYTASGYGGQFITVIPKLDLVIAHKTKLSLKALMGMGGKSVSDWDYYKFIQQILAAKKE